MLLSPERVPSCANYISCGTPSGGPFLYNSWVLGISYVPYTHWNFSGVVKAIQNGAMVFVLMASFQKPEPWQPSHAWPMPLNVPSPEACELEETKWARQAAQPGLDQRVVDMYNMHIEVGGFSLRAAILVYRLKLGAVEKPDSY